jgi:tetratricopeptide (TPR) repeat protein
LFSAWPFLRLVIFMAARRINFRMSILVLLLIAGTVGGIYVLHKFQVRRNAAALLATVDEKVAEENPTEAIDPLLKYLTLRPADNARHLQLAEILAERAFSGERSRERWALTKEVLRTAVTRNPEENDLREKLVVLLLEANESEAAIYHASELRKRTDAESDPERFGRIAMLYIQAALKAGKSDEVEKTLVELTQPLPGKPLPSDRIDAFVFLAAIMSEGRGRLQAAEEVLRKMVDAFPDSPRAWKVLAGWSRRNGKPEQAAEAIAKARALDPVDEEGILIDATVALAMGKPDRAEAVLASIPADAPLSEPLVMARAELARVRGDAPGMIEVLTAGREAIPSSKPLISELIVVLSDAGRTEDVVALLEAARKMLPEGAPAIVYGEASVAMAEGRWSQSLKGWERLKEVMAGDPSFNRRADIAMASCHDALGDTEKAAEARRRLAAAAPDSELAMFLEATGLEQAGKLEEAMAIIERMAAGIPPETLASRPEIWRALLRMRIAEQSRRPEAERDWTAVDGLVSALTAEGGLNAQAAARVRVDVLTAKGDGAGALSASEAAVAAHPDDVQLLAQSVFLLAESDRGDEAWARIDAAPEALRSSPGLLIAAIDLLVRTDRDAWGDRPQDLQDRILALPAAVARAARRQWLAFQVGQGAEAAAYQVAEAILTDDPDDMQVRMMLVDIAAERDDADEVAAQVALVEKQFGSDTAISRVARAVEKIVAVRVARRVSGNTDVLNEEEKKTLVEARKLVEEAAADRPDWEAPVRHLASITELEGDPAAAIGHLRRAIRRGESLPLARRRLVVLLVAAGRFGEAAPVIASLGTFGGPAVDRIRADSLATSGETEEALRVGASLTSQDPENVAQLTWHASLLARCGKPDEAEAACRKAIEVAPQDEAPRRTLVRLQVDRKLDAEARATRDAALAALAEPAKSRFKEYAAGLLGEGDVIESAYREAVVANGDDLDAARRLVEQYLARGRLKPAREELRRIVGLSSAKDSPTGFWARRQLAVQMAQGGSYREFLEAIALLALNVDGEGRQSADDMALEASLLLARNEPSSWRRGLQVLEILAERRPLTVQERVMREKARATLVPTLRPEAIKALGEIALSADGSTAMFAMLVELCLDEGDLVGADEWLGRLQGVSPEAPGTLRLMAKVAMAKGDDNAVARTVKRLLPEVRVTDATASRMVMAAMVVDDLGFHEEAGRVFDDYAGLTNDGVLLQARSLGRRHRTKEAIALAESVRAEVSPQAFLETLIAIARYTDADPESDALADVERIAATLRRENPGASDIAFSAAILEDAFGRTSRAMKSYRELLASRDLDPRLRGLVSANLAFDIAHPETADEATKLIDAAVAELGPTTDLLDSRAMVRLAKGQSRQALEDVSDAILLQPTPRNYLHLAVIRVAMRDLNAAADALAVAREKDLDEERLSPDDRRRLERVEAAIESGVPTS